MSMATPAGIEPATNSLEENGRGLTAPNDRTLDQPHNHLLYLIFPRRCVNDL